MFTQCVISPKRGIRVHGGVWQGSKVLRVPITVQAKLGVCVLRSPHKYLLHKASP